ncbi:hypothetical protein LINGRAHAP2_LOCUS28923 [Linum grandiflorum]
MALYRWSSDGLSDDSVSFSDIVFGFSEESGHNDHSSSSSSCSSSSVPGGFPDDEAEAENNPAGDSEERKKFWDTQNELLQGTLYRTSSLETKIRQSTRDALAEIESVGLSCKCGKSDGGCRNCLRREVSVRLRSKGYNCAICKSKWNGGRNNLLAGEHSYLEVVEESRKLGEVKIIIELNFRAEFEMAKASEEYNQLVSRLPEVFVGRVDRLKSLIKILCSAAKACMKEKKIHLAPWRKHKYMQSKWLGGGTVERVVPDAAAAAAALTAGYSHRPVKAKASMLTYDLTENQSRGLVPLVMHLPAVRVV